MRILRSRKCRTATLTFTIIGVFAGGFAYRNFDILGNYFDHAMRDLQYSFGPDGARKDLARGRFRAGDSVDDLIATHPPDRITRGGRYTHLRYAPPFSFDATTVLARDGTLAWAGAYSCAYGHVFFDELNVNEHTDANQAIHAADIAEHRAKIHARMAVVSTPIVISRVSSLLFPDLEPFE